VLKRVPFFNRVAGLFARLIYGAGRLFWRVTKPITLGVRVLLIKDHSVLLVRHTYQPSLWFLVGGGIQRHETLIEAARREAQEEVGAQLGHLELFGVYTNYFDYKSDHVLVFVCDDFALSGDSDREIAEHAFFPLAGLPESLAAGHRRRVDEYLNNKDDAPFVGMW
jgi:8-oxo-dGTP pyrophosphatase MutT (NUDIX family)